MRCYFLVGSVTVGMVTSGLFVVLVGSELLVGRIVSLGIVVLLDVLVLLSSIGARQPVRMEVIRINTREIAVSFFISMLLCFGLYNGIISIYGKYIQHKCKNLLPETYVL